jgi:hypothetical protein
MKAQVWSTDFIFSVSVFIIVLSSVLFVWTSMSAQSDEQSNFSDMQKKILQVSDSLVRISGVPDNWDSSTVETVGLSTGEENVLDSGKVSEFLSMLGTDYNRTRAMMGMGNYELYFELRYANDTVFLNSTIPITTDETNILSIDRQVIYNGKLAKARFVIWEDA